jgi:Acetyltransferase (GNAT) domain
LECKLIKTIGIVKQANEVYRMVVKDRSDIPIFFQDWWLDAVCGEEGWLGLVTQSGDYVKALWPLATQKRAFGRIYYIMPPLTPTMGIHFFYPKDQKYSSRLGYEKELVSDLLDQLGRLDFYQQCFIPEFTNWLPFYWKGFSQTTRYTYRLSPITNSEEVFNNFQENIRREIRKAIKLEIRIAETEDFNEFMGTVNMTFSRQNIEISFIPILEKINQNCAKKECRKMFIAIDKERRVHASLFLVWDNKTAYYLIGGGDPKLRNSGATSLLMFEAIKFAATKVNCFDFEGSMIEPIERFFRAFGAEQVPFFSISKMSRREKIIQAITSIMISRWK